jgi:hypothetical protein
LVRLVAQPDLPLPEVFRRVCEAAADALRVERVGVWLIVNEGKALRCASLFERSKHRHSKGVCLTLAEFPGFFRAIAAAPLVACESARSDPRTAELRESYLAPHGITSVLDAPLARNGRVVGVVCHEHVGPPRAWSEDDRAFALAAADLIVDRMKAAEGMLRTSYRDAGFAPKPNGRHAEAKPGAAAHEFRNLLAEIIANAELVAHVPGLPAGVADRLARIADAAGRGVSLVRALCEPAAAGEPDTGEYESLPRPPADDDTGEQGALSAAG